MKDKEMQELDAWLAENLMKWHTDISKSFYFDSRNRLGMSVVYWHPTTNIAQAFEVVEKMERDGWALILNSCINEPSKKRIVTAIICRDKNEQGVCPSEETVALAISIAAKKAWESK